MNDTRKFLTEFNEYWVREDTGAILGAVTDDIRFGMAGHDPINGKADFRKFLEEMGCDGTDMTLDLGTFVIEGDRAAVTGEIAMTDKEGQRKRFAFCDVYRLRDGKVAELTAFVNPIGGEQPCDS